MRLQFHLFVLEVILRHFSRDRGFLTQRALIRAHRSRIETVDGQLERIGLQRLHARTNPGFALKV